MRHDWRRAALKQFQGSPRLSTSFLFLSLTRQDELLPFTSARPGSCLHRFLDERPEAPGALLWSYQCAAWDSRTRIQRIASHFAALERLPEAFRFGVHEKLELLDFSSLSEGARLILDQPRWFMHEGQFALNLFQGDYRAYSLSFSLVDGPRPEVFIGGVQGRSTADALERYRQLTRDFHGMRPRDLLIELARMVARHLDAQRICGVADAYRYIRHPFFAGGRKEANLVDYDEMWTDRGAARVAATHFVLPTAVERRSLEEVPSKKRSLYRKRYEMLDRLDARLARASAVARPVAFEAI